MCDDSEDRKKKRRHEICHDDCVCGYMYVPILKKEMSKSNTKCVCVLNAYMYYVFVVVV